MERLYSVHLKTLPNCHKVTSSLLSKMSSVVELRSREQTRKTEGDSTEG